MPLARGSVGLRTELYGVTLTTGSFACWAAATFSRPLLLFPVRYAPGFYLQKKTIKGQELETEWRGSKHTRRRAEPKVDIKGTSV